MHFYLADFEKLKADMTVKDAKIPELSEADADCVQVVPLCILPDKRVALTEMKRNKLDGDVEEEQEEEENDLDQHVKQERDDIEAINYDQDEDGDFTEINSDYQLIRTRQVKEKLDDLMEEAKANHTNLVMQNQKLQKLVQVKKAVYAKTKSEGEMNDYKYLRTLGNAYVVRKKLKETQDRYNKLSEEMQNQL